MGEVTLGADAETIEIDLDEDPLVLSDGTVLNEDAAARYGRQVADRAAARRAGRPSLSGGSEHSPRVSARVSVQTYTRLKRRAEAEHRAVSDVIRAALDNYV